MFDCEKSNQRSLENLFLLEKNIRELIKNYLIN
jgi:hypothetical protein